MTSDETSHLPSKDPLDEALSRLDKAVGAIQSRMTILDSQPSSSESSSHDDDHLAQLEEALAVSRAREGELKLISQEASQALGEAIDELRQALASTEPG